MRDGTGKGPGTAGSSPQPPVLAADDAGFAALFEYAPLPLWICDADSLRILRANAAATARYGWDEAGFRTRTLHDLRPATGGGSSRDAGPLPDGTHRHCDALGARRTVELASSPVLWQGRKALLVAVSDIGDRGRAEQALRRAHMLARIATWHARVEPDTSRSGPLSVDIACTPELLCMLGLDPAAGQPAPGALCARVEPEDRTALHRTVRAAIADGTAFDAELRFRRPDGGTLHLRIGGQPAQAGGAVLIDGYCQDVSEGRAALAALRQADKLSAMGQLTGGVAHDFNNLLTVVSANIDLAMAGMADGETRRMLAEAAAAARRGAALTAQLLAFARRQSLRPATIALAPFLDAFAGMVTRTLGDRHPVLVPPVAPGLAVLCDQGQLESALLNLVLNARDAMPDGGPITIEALPGAPLATVRVRDRGIGIAPELRERVLEPFFTTKPPGQGTGLGLSMALGFARQSGGELTVESTPGQGSTLSLLLPRADLPEPAQQPPAPRPDAVLPALDVLLVEDDSSVRAVALSIFERFGARVTGAATAEEALELLAAGLPCRLLFTDIVLGPGLDGFELGRRARRARPGLAVLFTSGYNERAADAAGSPEIAACELLPKPYGIGPLREAVERALAAAPAPG